MHPYGIIFKHSMCIFSFIEPYADANTKESCKHAKTYNMSNADGDMPTQ